VSEKDNNCPDCPKQLSDNRDFGSGADLSGDGPTVLVTGAGGFVGQKLCGELAKRGYKLRVLVRNDGADAFFKSIKAQIYNGDIRDHEVVDCVCDGVSGVFHLASIVQRAGIPDRDFWDVHVTATRNLMAACVKYNVSRVVHCSTIGVLGHITSPPADESSPYNVEDIYQKTKAEGEKVAMEYHRVKGVPVTIVRPAAVYGPGDRRLLKLFRMIASGRFVMVGDGKTLIHPVYIDDLVEGMILACERPEAVGEIFILGGPEYISISRWAEIIASQAGVSLPGLSIPYYPVKVAAMLCEGLFRPLGLEPPLFRRRVDFFVKNRAFSIDKAKNRLGYDPKVGTSEGARLTIAWYRERGWIK